MTQRARPLVALAISLVPVVASCGDRDEAPTAATADVAVSPSMTSFPPAAATGTTAPEPAMVMGTPAPEPAMATTAAPTTVTPPIVPTVTPPIAQTAAPNPTAPTSTVPVPTTVVLPQPEPPPLDEGASEPVIEQGRIRIDAIGLDATLYEGIRLPTFDLGPGRWPGTAQPGQVGNMVVGGHRTSGNADFRHLDQLEPGDEMVVTDDQGTEHRYAVESTEIIDPFFARVVYQTPERTATLFACHPPGSVAQRIVVHLTAVT